MTNAEFVEWQVFSRSWPIGEARLDLHFAQLCNLIASALGSKSTVRDWMLRTDPEELRRAEQEPITDEDISALFGANVRRIKK